MAVFWADHVTARGASDLGGPGYGIRRNPNRYRWNTTLRSDTISGDSNGPLELKAHRNPLLSIINHMTMVASKASKICRAAGTRPVLEFGSRRTHPEAAVDAAYAAFVGGCVGTSNVEAYCKYGIPTLGTMDHFAIQAWERVGVPRHETERAFFEAYFRSYPEHSILLVDTYDAYGPQTGDCGRGGGNPRTFEGHPSRL